MSKYLTHVTSAHGTAQKIHYASLEEVSKKTFMTNNF